MKKLEKEELDKLVENITGTHDIRVTDMLFSIHD
tara:strand:+ start:1649 stop:1750 length:102 start_codon:yes stop_codon:yes gene_type:complete